MRDWNQLFPALFLILCPIAIYTTIALLVNRIDKPDRGIHIIAVDSTIGSKEAERAVKAILDQGILLRTTISQLAFQRAWRRWSAQLLSASTSYMQFCTTKIWQWIGTNQCLPLENVESIGQIGGDAY
jgi:hypothetical protein